MTFSSAATYTIGHDSEISSVRSDSNYRPHITFNDELAFKTYLRRWIEETKYDSSPLVKSRNENFRAIVGLGKAIAPLIVDELRIAPSYLVIALEEMFGDRIGDDVNGLAQLSKEWVEWLTKSSFGRD